MTATNATSTRPDTSSAMQSMGSSCFITRTATATLKAEMSHAHQQKRALAAGPQARKAIEHAERAFRLRMLEQHVFDREVARHEAEDEQAAAERERDKRKNMRHGARPCERVGRRCTASAAKRLRSEQAYRANGNASEGDDQAEQNQKVDTL